MKARTPSPAEPGSIGRRASRRRGLRSSSRSARSRSAFPALGGGFLVNPRSDQYIAGYPFREFAASVAQAGHGIPQWNPYLFGGMPYVAAMHGDIFYPTFLLRMILPTDVAMTWAFIIHIFLAGLFTYLFLRAWGSASCRARRRHRVHDVRAHRRRTCRRATTASCTSARCCRSRSCCSCAAFATGETGRGARSRSSIGLAVLSPHPQLLQYMLLACGAFALYLAFAELELPDGRARVSTAASALDGCSRARRGGPRRCRSARCSSCPVREYVPFSPRAGGPRLRVRRRRTRCRSRRCSTPICRSSPACSTSTGDGTASTSTASTSAPPCSCSARPLGLTSERRGFRWFWIGALIVVACSGHSAATRRSIISCTRSSRARSSSARRARCST